MTLEQYIMKRKDEDGIDEFDKSKRSENIRICVNYIFEYFDNYLDSAEENAQSIFDNQKIEKYRKQLADYDPKVRNWLVSLYTAHGKYMNRHLEKLISDKYFLLYSEEPEFRSLAYKITSEVSTKFDFMRSQSEAIYDFIKERHRLESDWHEEYDEANINEEIDAWIRDTYEKHSVNIHAFCEGYIDWFFDHPEAWPKGSKKKSERYNRYIEYRKNGQKISEYLLWDYDMRCAVDPFGINRLYRDMPKKSFVKNRKKDLLVVLSFWAYKYTGDHDFWDEYTRNLELYNA